MARASEGNEQLLCSFCGKSQRQVKKLIAGPGVYICDECIDLCNEIIDEELDELRRSSTSTISRSRSTSTPSSTTTSSRRKRRSARSRSRSTTTTSACGWASRTRRSSSRSRTSSSSARPAAEDAPRADPRADPQRPVRDRGRDGADGGRLRRRGRREHPPQADPGGGLRHQEGGDRDHLHRRGGQDRAQGGQPVDHAGRLRRGRAAGAPEDPRGHGRLGAAAGWAQAPAPGVPLDRHDEHPLHLRRRVRRPRQDHRAPDREEHRRASPPTFARATRPRAPSS